VQAHLYICRKINKQYIYGVQQPLLIIRNYFKTVF
jgi:hypothetical protein